MTKPIRTYKELMQEKERLQLLLKAQKAIIREDFRGIRQELEPARIAVKSIGRFFSRDSSNYILNAGAGALIDLLTRKFLLARAGWLTKHLVPFLLKNFSSHFISENKESFVRKILAWLGKRHANGQEQHPAAAAAE